MEELLKFLDPFLVLENVIFEEKTIKFYVKSSRTDVVCPYCNSTSSKAHSHYSRSFQDLPIQGKKVIIVLNNRKMFCKNPTCNHKTFAETFNFLTSKAKKSNRLTEEIVNISLNVSSVTASELLRGGIVDVSKSTICTLLKKRHTGNQ
ncbi:MAG: transposase family protein [Ruminiclostridium sp.]